MDSIRLAYVYLSAYDTDTAHQLMRSALLSFLEYHGVDVSKYHETITRAWIMAVRHFMENTPSSESSDIFMQRRPRSEFHVILSAVRGPAERES